MGIQSEPPKRNKTSRGAGVAPSVLNIFLKNWLILDNTWNSGGQKWVLDISSSFKQLLETMDSELETMGLYRGSIGQQN